MALMSESEENKLCPFSPSIVTKQLNVTHSFGVRVRAYLNLKRPVKRGQVRSTVIHADTLDSDCIEQVHAFAAWTLATSLGWSDTDLLPIQLNRLGKQNDSGDELIWICRKGITLKDILHRKSYWFDDEWKKGGTEAVK